jgi:hypothetical protein
LVFDHAAGDALVAAELVDVTGTAELWPAIGDVRAWQRRAIAIVDGPSRAIKQEGDS